MIISNIDQLVEYLSRQETTRDEAIELVEKSLMMFPDRDIEKGFLIKAVKKWGYNKERPIFIFKDDDVL